MFGCWRNVNEFNDFHVYSFSFLLFANIYLHNVMIRKLLLVTDSLCTLVELWGRGRSIVKDFAAFKRKTCPADGFSRRKNFSFMQHVMFMFSLFNVRGRSASIISFLAHRIFHSVDGLSVASVAVDLIKVALCLGDCMCVMCLVSHLITITKFQALSNDR